MIKTKAHTTTFSVYLTTYERGLFDGESYKEGMYLSRWIKQEMAKDTPLEYSKPLAPYQERFEMFLDDDLKARVKAQAAKYGISMTEYARYRCHEAITRGSNTPGAQG